MKSLTKLGVLVALAAATSLPLQAVTVDLAALTTAEGTGTQTYTDSQGNVYYGFYNSGAAPGSWTQATYAIANGIGLGVRSSVSGIPARVEDLANNEFLVIDFGANYLNKSAFQVDFDGSGSFTYYWSSTLPAGSTPTLGLAESNTTPVNNSLQSLTGGDRYLILGAVPNAYLALNQVSYSQVPDGGETLALMGAALATLGLAVRRRKL